MIEKLKEIRNKILYIYSHEEADKMDAHDAVVVLLSELEAKEAADTPVSGQLQFSEKSKIVTSTDPLIVDLESVIIHEGDISNGKKWFAISGILIEKE